MHIQEIGYDNGTKYKDIQSAGGTMTGNELYRLALKSCSEKRNPPAKKHMPNTSTTNAKSAK